MKITILSILSLFLFLSFGFVNPDETLEASCEEEVHFEDDTADNMCNFSMMRPFVTTWKTDNEAVSNSTSITIPTFGLGYNYEIDWNYDGTTFDVDESGINGDATHDYGVAGTYTVAIRGDFPMIFFTNLISSEQEKILSVDQWGDISWQSMAGAFYGCSNLLDVDSASPDLSDVLSMQSMFREASSLNSNLNSWDVSSVTDMGHMFREASSLNSNLNNWDVSNVTDMGFMFEGAENFNSDISSWDVSNVTDMSAMFADAENFNSNISSWDVSNVTNMRRMFQRASKFNSDVSSWDVSNVTDMSATFSCAENFNSNISSWDVSNVTDMIFMFLRAKSFNSDISSWDVSNVTDMAGMFAVARNFNSDISNWDVRSVIKMRTMFDGAESFNSDISSWDVSKVEIMGSMFLGATSFNRSLANWNLESVTNYSNDPFQEMLDNSGLSQANYESTLLGWANNPSTPSNLILGAESLEYCDETGRDALQAKGWGIVGDIRLNEGDACDDGNPNTMNDIINATCECVGEQPNSVSFQTSNAELKISPNPANDYIRILDVNQVFKKGTIKFYNSLGVLLQQNEWSINNDINIEKLPTGLLFYTLTDQDSKAVSSGRIIIARR